MFIFVSEDVCRLMTPMSQLHRSEPGDDCPYVKIGSQITNLRKKEVETETERKREGRRSYGWKVRDRKREVYEEFVMVQDQ